MQTKREKIKNADESVLTMVKLGILTAVIVLMSLTPVGYLRLGPFAISFLMVPVAIGAMHLGPVSGLILGTVFGITSFIQCFTGDVLGGALLAVSAWKTALMCLLPRMAAGFLTGLLFRLFYKIDRTKTVSFFLSGLLAAVLNTVFFVGILLLFFYKSDYIQNLFTENQLNGIFAFFGFFVGINGIIEAIVTALIGGACGKVLHKILRHSSDGEYL